MATTPKVIAKLEVDEPTLKLAVLIDADNAQATIIEGLLAEIATFGEQERMTTPKKTRATALVPWSHDDKQGILVHADRDKNEWTLPGGGLLDANGPIETPRAAVVRELAEETGLTAAAVATLFRHKGRLRVHHVFHIRPSGRLQIVDLKEAPAFGLCGPNLVVDTIACSPDYSTDGLALSHSTKAIIRRYQAEYQQPDNARAPSTVAGGDSETTRVQIGASALELTTGDIVTQDVDASESNQ
jgi:8-oxo-dGTP pyrophosphatase MutT (NUDIX family)